jgi:large subunit ribosomal protein L21
LLTYNFQFDEKENDQMYAVFEDGSRQYKVSEGDKVKVDFRDAEIGSRLEFPRVLLYAGGETVHIGQPIVAGARITAEVIEHPSTKTYVQHFRRRKNYRRLRGHRQPYTQVQIRNILLGGESEKEKSEASNPKSETNPKS